MGLPVDEPLYRLPVVDEEPAWVPSRRPPADVCARRFCFHFVARGARFGAGLHPNREAGLAAAMRVAHDACSSASGRCRRLGVDADDADHYEPCEPELERAGLPWFYFIASELNLVEELRARYLEESQRLWGKPFVRP